MMPRHVRNSQGMCGLPALAANQLLESDRLTDLKPVPSVRMLTDWLEPPVEIDMVPFKVPEIDRFSLLPLALPATLPDELNARSSQLPETVSPDELRLARSSILFACDEQVSAMPRSAPAFFGL
jgi:hypothetical protein